MENSEYNCDIYRDEKNSKKNCWKFLKSKVLKKKKKTYFEGNWIFCCIFCFNFDFWRKNWKLLYFYCFLWKLLFLGLGAKLMWKFFAKRYFNNIILPVFRRENIILYKRTMKHKAKDMNFVCRENKKIWKLPIRFPIKKIWKLPIWIISFWRIIPKCCLQPIL